MGKSKKLRAERKEQEEAVRAAEPAMPAVKGGAKLVLAVVVLGLAAIIVWTVIYRADHPSMTIKQERQAAEHGDEGGGTQAMGGMGGMNMISELMKKLEQNPKDVHILHTLGEQFMRMQAWDRAEALLNRALVVEPSNVDVLNLIGITEFNLKRFEDSAGKFEMILELEPDNVMARYNLGVLYGHFLDDKARAATYLQEVIDAPGVDDQTRDQARETLKELSQ